MEKDNLKSCHLLKEIGEIETSSSIHESKACHSLKDIGPINPEIKAEWQKPQAWIPLEGIDFSNVTEFKVPIIRPVDNTNVRDVVIADCVMDLRDWNDPKMSIDEAFEFFKKQGYTVVK
jgi:hypothetical protein